MTDTLDTEVNNLFGSLPEAPEPIEPVAEQPQAQEPDPTPTPEPASQEAQEPVTPQEPETPKDAHSVPLTVLLDERDKAKRARREADDLRRQMAEMQAKQSPQAVPDPYEDPTGYHEHVQSLVQQQQFALRAEMSGRFAEQKYGKETVEAAIAWAQEQGAVDPFLGQRVQAHQSPVEFVVEQFNREQFFKQYGSDPSALAAAQTPQQTAAPQSPPVIPAQRQPAPPRSLAAAPNAGGGHQAVGGSVFDSIKLNLD